MLGKIIQKLKNFINRHFNCNHRWIRLSHHNLPNEPYLVRCEVCKWITEDSDLLD